MKKPPQISVLVPIYNVEKYLPQCLDSLLAQTFQNLEIICINDGSTDSSLQIIQRYAAKDSRIVIINKANSGYGDSMNQGLAQAKGEYIGILESDDFLDPQAFETLYLLAEKYQAEVVRANYYHYLGGKNTKQSVVDPAAIGRLVDPRTERYAIYRPPAIWSGLYRREFLRQHHITFLPTPGASYQDTGFNFKIWASARRAAFTSQAFLHYRLDNESSSVNNPGKIYCVCDEFAEIERYLKSQKLYSDFSDTFELAKFRAYLWNIDRLSFNFARRFLARIRQEYRAAPPTLAIFPRSQRWRLRLILALPPSLYCFCHKLLYRLKS